MCPHDIHTLHISSRGEGVRTLVDDVQWVFDVPPHLLNRPCLVTVRQGQVSYPRIEVDGLGDATPNPDLIRAVDVYCNVGAVGRSTESDVTGPVVLSKLYTGEMPAPVIGLTADVDLPPQTLTAISETRFKVEALPGRLVFARHWTFDDPVGISAPLPDASDTAAAYVSFMLELEFE
jgi:hypothetical protein